MFDGDASASNETLKASFLRITVPAKHDRQEHQ